MFRIRIQNKKKCIWYCSAVVSFLLFLLLLGWTNHLANTQDAQQMAGRWSEKKDVAQISCFFSSKAEVTEDTIQSFEYSLKNVLQEASITETSENPRARLWVDAYSADGKITLVNGKNTLSSFGRCRRRSTRISLPTRLALFVSWPWLPGSTTSAIWPRL